MNGPVFNCKSKDKASVVYDNEITYCSNRIEKANDNTTARALKGLEDIHLQYEGLSE